MQLDTSLFHSLIKISHFYIPILFCQKWREKCYNFQSIWKKVGEHYHENNDIIIASIDTSYYSSIEEELKIKTYPKIIIFDKNSKIIEFNKDKLDYKDIVDFINETGGILDEDINIKPDDNNNDEISTKEEEHEEEERNTDVEDLEDEL